MKAIACALLLALSCLLTAQEQKVKWQRVYTLDDMVIEIDPTTVTFVEEHVSKKVMFASTRVGRVSFRTVYAKPQQQYGEPRKTYKVRLEEIEFECGLPEGVVFKEDTPAQPLVGKYYRHYQTKLLDERGTMIEHNRSDASEEWKEVRFGSVMEKLSLAACKLIDEKRRNP